MRFLKVTEKCVCVEFSNRSGGTSNASSCVFSSPDYVSRTGSSSESWGDQDSFWRSATGTSSCGSSRRMNSDRACSNSAGRHCGLSHSVDSRGASQCSTGSKTAGETGTSRRGTRSECRDSTTTGGPASGSSLVSECNCSPSSRC